MNINRQRFLAINKYATLAAALAYLEGTFLSRVLQPGLLFAMAAGFFVLLHRKYFEGRLKLAAHVWLVPAVMGGLTTQTLMEAAPSGQNLLRLGLVLAIALPAFGLLFTGKASGRPSRAHRLRIVSARILVQVTLFVAYAAVTSAGVILGSRLWLAYWAAFHVVTTALLPFVIGRALCGWICPNATLQDALLKNLQYPRPIPRLGEAIEAQSRSKAISMSGPVDARAPYLPFTLLLSFFPMFVAETVFNLTESMWYPIGFIYGLFFLSFLMPWRKACTHFCWLSSYRAVAGHLSLWRLRFNRSRCRDCGRCLAEEACPFYIDIRAQVDEMPASCCLCFSCMEACPFPGVIAFRRAGAEDSAKADRACQPGPKRDMQFGC